MSAMTRAAQIRSLLLALGIGFALVALWSWSPPSLEQARADVARVERRAPVILDAPVRVDSP